MYVSRWRKYPRNDFFNTTRLIWLGVFFTNWDMPSLQYLVDYNIAYFMLKQFRIKNDDIECMIWIYEYRAKSKCQKMQNRFYAKNTFYMSDNLSKYGPSSQCFFFIKCIVYQQQVCIDCMYCTYYTYICATVVICWQKNRCTYNLKSTKRHLGTFNFRYSITKWTNNQTLICILYIHILYL